MDCLITHSPEETMALGVQLGRTLQANSVLCFFGDLGAGKTTFIRGIAEGAAEFYSVNSPTYVYLNVYRGTQTLYHFDLYRLTDADEFLSMGFDELFDSGAICLIEWSEKIASILPKQVISVRMKHLGDDTREISIDGP